jgi:hypothetical protein
MRFDVGAVVFVLLLAATRPSSAQPGGSAAPSTPPAASERGWTWDGGIGAAVTFIDSNGTEFHPCLALRFGAGRWITPEATLSLRLAWNMELTDNHSHDFEPNPTLFSSFAGPRIARWLNDRLWLAGTLGASFSHLESYGEYRRPYDDIAFAFGGDAGVAAFENGVETVSVSVEAMRALDDGATTTLSILVEYQRL